ncbi:MAG: tetratricopeptide repeat protein [Proteobacteria bacterium]|nr:tetratricopeptide repeat protein [Pseudomonadota bacterium]
MLKKNNSCVVLLLLAYVLISAQPCLAEEDALQGNIEVARGLFKDGLYDLAAKEFNALRDNKDTDQCEVNLYLSKAYFSLENYPSIPKLMDVFFDDGCSFDMQEEAYYISGNVYLKLGDRGKARERFEKIRDLYPESEHIAEVDASLSEIIYQEGIQFFNERKYSKALDNFEKVQKLKSDISSSPDLSVRIADSLFHLAKFKKSSKVYGDALKLLPDGEEKGRILYQLSYIDFNMGNYDSAATAMISFIEKTPDHPLLSSAHSLVSWALYKDDRYEESLSYFNMLRKGEKETLSIEAYDLMGISSRLIFLGEYIEAMGMLEEGLKRFGEDPLKGDLLLVLAEAYQRAEYDYMEQETYREIIKRYPSSRAARKSLFALGLINFSKSVYKESAVNFRAFVEKNSLVDMADEAIYYLGESLFRMGQMADAKEQFVLLSTNFKTSKYFFEATVRLADIASISGQHMEAGKGYLSILKSFDQNEKEVLWKGAQSFKKGGDLKSALKLYKNYIRQYPDSPEAKVAALVMAEMRFLTGDYDKGIKLLKGLIKTGKKDPSYPTIALKLARGYIQTGNIPDAISTLKIIIEEYPDSSEAAPAYYLKAWSAERSGLLEKANNDYAEFIKKFPDSPLQEELMWQLGKNQLSLGEYKNALKTFKRFTKTFPSSYRDGESMQGKCYSAMGEFKKALEVSTTFSEMNPGRTIDIKKYYEEAMALFDVGSYGDAVKVAKRLFEKFPGHQLSAKLMIMAAEVAFKDAYMEEASSHYLSAAGVLTESSLKNLARFRLGKIASLQKDYRGALVELEQIAEHEADNEDKKLGIEEFIDPKLMMAKSLFLKGEAAFALSMNEKGLESFKRLAEEYSTVGGIDREWLKVGLTFQQYKEYDAAVKVLRTLIAATESTEIKAEAQYWIGESFQYQGRHEEAVVEYLKVTYLYPTEGMWALTSRYMAAQVYQKMGGYKEAVRLYEKVARESGDKRKSEYARKRIEELTAKIADIPGNDNKED